MLDFIEYCDSDKFRFQFLLQNFGSKQKSADPLCGTQFWKSKLTS